MAFFSATPEFRDKYTVTVGYLILEISDINTRIFYTHFYRRLFAAPWDSTLLEYAAPGTQCVEQKVVKMKAVEIWMAATCFLCARSSAG